jgi:hypothetical protein
VAELIERRRREPAEHFDFLSMLMARAIAKATRR